jgi:hypothetical protein
MLFVEILAFFLIGISLFFFRNENDKRPLLCFPIALFTVGVGETLNYISKTTIYNSSFIMLLSTKIPIFIIPAGAALSSWTSWLSLASEKRLKKKHSSFLTALLISIFLPFLSEFIGVGLSLWHWNIHLEFSFNFLAGIWKFYFIFLLSPVFLILMIKDKKNKNTT